VPARAFLDDLTVKNVLVENGALSGIIDVDFVCYGDPLLAVGATMASAADLPDAAAFYAQELVRCSNPNDEQRLAILFYAALWAIGSLSLTDPAAEPTRASALSRAAQSWLGLAEQQ
jgi:aminoglycoside phosphotransferase (APT) family kinase protein